MILPTFKATLFKHVYCFSLLSLSSLLALFSFSCTESRMVSFVLLQQKETLEDPRSLSIIWFCLSKYFSLG